MKSIRLDENLSDRLSRAAAAVSQTESEFIREAVARHCDEVLVETLADRLQDVVGAIRSQGGRADRTGQAFTQALKRRKQP